MKHLFITLVLLLAVAVAAMSGAADMATVGRGDAQPRSSAQVSGQFILVEAEAFRQRGGWVVDPQFLDQMGSPYLLAHGLGRPVADAATEVEFPAAGNYRVWVRTKDWVAPWQPPGAPGKFQLLVNGRPLDTLFGTEEDAAGTAWKPQSGGPALATWRFDPPRIAGAICHF